jgi:hypothetical protein
MANNMPPTELEIQQARLGVDSPWDVQNKSRAITAAMARQDNWPYPWAYMPPGGRPFNRAGSVAAPNYNVGNMVEITGTRYEVPAGYMGVITGLWWQYVGTGFVNGSGNVVVSVTVNQPLGLTSLAGYSLPDYNNMVVALGDASYPWPVAGGWVLDEGNVVRMTAYTVATVGQGAPNYVLGGVLGWIWPSQTGRR